MKLFPIAIGSLVIGCGLGVALAYVEVGKVTNRLAPPPREGEELIDLPSGPNAKPLEVPVAEVDREVHDFGTMQRGSKQSHAFMFTNAGKQPLTLEVGATSCKCTLGEVADRPLAPGESMPVTLEWVAKSLPGQFRQVATIKTNDPRKPTIELTVEGLVTENASLKPEQFMLGRISTDDVATATVYVASYEEDAPPLEATVKLNEDAPAADRCEFTVESVPVEELPMDRATSGVKITVKAGPGLPIGHLTEWVTVETNQSVGDGDGQSIQVPMMAIVEGDISLHGAGWSKEAGLLNLGRVTSSEGEEAKLRISYKGEHATDLRAEVASVDPAWLEVELSEPKKIRDGVYHQPMTVRIPPGQRAVVRSGMGAENGGIGPGDARIRLSFNHPSTSELDVRVRFVIAE